MRAVLAAIVATLALASPASAANLALAPATATPGQTVTVTGGDYPARAWVDIYLDSAKVARVRASASHTITATLTAPTTPGTYQVIAKVNGAEWWRTPLTVSVPYGGAAITRPVGSPILADVDASARVKRSAWEPRPANAAANAYRPTDADLSYWRAHNPDFGACVEALKAHVTGRHGLANPTTDELIQWTAHKWGIAEDLVRAAAAKESWWKQDSYGDMDGPPTLEFPNGSPSSYGLTSVRRNANREVGPDWNGTFPLAKNSTAFNLDYWAMSVRQYFEGCAGSGVSPDPTGDILASATRWFVGWGSLTDPSAQQYRADLESYVRDRVWAQPGF